MHRCSKNTTSSILIVWMLVAASSFLFACDEGNGTSFFVAEPAAAPTVVLSDLPCAEDQVAKIVGGVWTCTADDDTDTLAGLSCLAGQVAKLSAGVWVCAADADTDTLGTLVCADGQVVKSSGGTWTCGADANTDADTLVDINCDPGDFARQDPTTGLWVCVSLAELKLAMGLTNTVFVTSANYDGDLVTQASDIAQFNPAYGGSDGLEAGDFICNAHAADAGLRGDFVAWLSTSSIDAIDRLTPGSGPFLTTDGNWVADDVADLTDNSLSSPINADEDGNGSVNSIVWTGTFSNGTGIGSNCLAWTNLISLPSYWGRSSDTSGAWTQESLGGCFAFYRLYCFQL